MKTEIFNSYEDFLNREDKTINGVSKEFSEQNENWAEEKENEACWNCSSCSSCIDCGDCSDCSSCSSCIDCGDCSDCSYCSYCLDCRYCSDCSDCRSCSDCRYCSSCSDKKEEKNKYEDIFETKIENIHQSILNATSKPNALKMSSWHEDEKLNGEGAYCGTTHCRAGWVVTLAGKKGKQLEDFYGSTWMAAKRIYKNSSKIEVSLNKFFVSNEEAMKDIQRCAELELNSKL